MTEFVSREIRLASRPTGEPGADDFELVAASVPQPGPGQILVRNTWMSVDPYMRGRMNDAPSYIESFRIGAPLEGSALGEVVTSRTSDIPAGATVSHFSGWREYAVLDAAGVQVVDTTVAPPQEYLGALGATGLTAYVAVTDIAPVRPGDVAFVSSAAGAVGSVAGQVARILGAGRVIGSAGGPAKTALVTDTFGFDAAIDYKAGPVGPELARLAPDGIDVFVDGVGGDQLEAAIGALRVGGRAALVGAISGYNAVAPRPGPSNLYQVVVKRLTLRGMLVNDHLDRFEEYASRAAKWLASGELRSAETVAEGIDQAVPAFLGLLRGSGIGKVLVRLP